MEKQNVIRDLMQSKIIVVIRGLRGEALQKTAEALYAGGIRFAEVTFNSCGEPSDGEIAAEIRALSERWKGRMHIGAGTVLTPRQVHLAKKAGAEFLISPNTDEAIIRKTVRCGLVSIPGAFTASEAVAANRAGADFVKLFPAGEMAPSYVRDLATPLSQIRFLAVGGITAQNLRAYLDAGACGAGVSGGIVNKALISEGKFSEITSLAASYTKAAGINLTT